VGWNVRVAPLGLDARDGAVLARFVRRIHTITRIRYQDAVCRYHLLFWLQVREVITDIVFEMWRDGALIERFAGRALVLRKLLLVRHQRWIGYARQIGLTLLGLRLAARALLALNRLRSRLLVGWVVWLVD
jgi:hypothetical protein